MQTMTDQTKPLVLHKFKFIKNNTPGRESQRREFKENMAPVSILVDASSDNGSGHSYGASIFKYNSETKEKRLLYLGEMDNNHAELYSVLAGISLLASLCTSKLFANKHYFDFIKEKKNVCFYTDSKTVISKCHAVKFNMLEDHKDEIGIELARRIFIGFDMIRSLDIEPHLIWIPRYLNSEADSLSKLRPSDNKYLTLPLIPQPIPKIYT